MIRLALLTIRICSCFLFICLGSYGFASELTDNDGLPEVVQFSDHIRPIFAAHCTACHGGVKQAGGLSFVYEDRVLAEADSGVPIVVPGDAEASYLIERVVDPDPDSRMPPSDHGPALSDQEIALLKKWIEQGALWAQPWALVAPQPHHLPTVSEPDWCRTSIDNFVLARLEEEGQDQTQEATRRRWLRRVSLDLVGLPPTLAEMRDFEQDDHPDAYSRVVDRLFNSPRYGEKWASLWLDLSRYADTMGYEKDLERSAWPYRDWLIRALNEDMPYDQFIIKQLAGDLLPESTIDDLIATAFNRNTQTNTEGGTDDEEFRISAVVDRVNTTWQVFGAMTFGCTQCHSHPYDPFENEEYYRCLAFFNNSRDADLHNDFPRLPVPINRDKFAEAAELDRRTLEIESQLHEIRMEAANEIGAWTYLSATQAETTGNATLDIRTSENGVSEVWAEGTLSVGSQFTFEYELPTSDVALTAVRIDALPHDLEQSRHIPEFGFALSRLRAWLVPPEGEPLEIKFVTAFCDEPRPQHDPQSSLQDNGLGWSQYTKIYRPCFAVFVTDQPIALPSGSTLRLELQHKLNANDTTAMAIRRARVAISGNTHWFNHASDSTDALQKELREIQARRKSIESVALPVMRELQPNASRKTFQFVRGSWLDHGQQVIPAVPSIMHDLPKDVDLNRLALAKWFASQDNPLTARVAVNRLWDQLFGIGIVATAEDFGTSGSRPSHPELLDYLACKFQGELQWSTKSLLREIVLSATYRQSSTASEEVLLRDPGNRLLARGPRTRLTAEMVRDQALAAAGILSDKMYGPPVMPPQPAGIWKSVYNGAKWKTAEGEERHRRAIYTFWKRTSAYPSMVTFDVPSREVCSSRRITTNTPLQALVTLNDQAYVECAEALAKRISAEGGPSPREKISLGYELVVGESLSKADLIDLLELYALATAHYVCELPSSSASEKDIREATECFALTAVSSALLNSDRALTK